MDETSLNSLFLGIIHEKYEGDKTIEKLVFRYWNKVKSNKNFTPALQPSGKSEEIAEMLRTKGNEYYSKRDFKKAIELYNLSIMAAPHPVLGEEDARLLGVITREQDLFSIPRIDLARYGGMDEGESSHALAKGFANRSAVLLELKMYKKCIVDINLAIEYGYPCRNLKKLEKRRQKCRNLKKLEERRQKCKERLLKKSTVRASKEEANEKKADPKSKIDIMIERLKLQLQVAEKKDPSLEDILSAELPKTPKLVDPNPKAPSLSSSVIIDSVPLKGRGIFACRDIRPGEILAVERSFVVGIDQSKLSTFCSTCANKCLTPLPCPGCSQVIFCSKSCRARGLAEDHWLECKLLKTVNSMECKEWSCAYKMLKTYSHRHLQSIVKELNKEQHNQQQSSVKELDKKEQNQSTSKLFDKREQHQQIQSTSKEFYNGEHYRPLQSTVKDIDKEEQYQQPQFIVKDLDKEQQANPLCLLGFDKEGVYRSESYRSLYHLCYNPRGLPSQLLLMGCVISLAIAKFLEESGRYFINNSGEPFTPTKEDIVEVCKILNNNIIRKEINSFGLKHAESEDFVMFPTLSLINHACYPTAAMVSYGRESVIVAVRPIYAGEEVTVYYRSPFYEANKEDRQMKLMMHDLSCKCEACEGNWPMYGFSGMPETQFKCLHCLKPQSDGVVICSQCELLMSKKSCIKRMAIYKEEKKIVQALNDLEHIRYDVTVKDIFNEKDYFRLCEISDIIHQHSVMPCKRLILLQCLIADYTEHGHFRTQSSTGF